MRKWIKGLLFLALGMLVFTGSFKVKAFGDSLAVSKTNLVIDSYEFGPGVSKIVLETNQNLSGVAADSQTSVTTAGISRQVKASYLSDERGDALRRGARSRYVTLELEVTYNADDPSQSASPFTFNLDTYRNAWVGSYMVKVSGLKAASSGSRRMQTIDSEQEAINNRVTPSAERFSERGTNSMQYAAYTPQSAAGGEKNPLIVWLHGVGEAGTDINLPLLSSEVVNLTKDGIQNHFTSTGTGAQSGAYVLAVQAPTPWSVDQYSDALMETIKSYVANHPDVDADRIYLAGASNGGGMTLGMGIKYPDYFAALVPIAAPYSYQTNNENGKTSYSLDDRTLKALKDQPMWLIHAATDTTLAPSESALPFYKALIDAKADNKWISYYESVIGTEMPNMTYNGHWSWVYFFNDQVNGVQSTANIGSMDGLNGLVATNPTQGGASKATVDGREYSNIFDWLNAQSKGNR